MVRNPLSQAQSTSKAAEFPAHDGCVMQGLADGNIAVIGHGG